MSYNGWTNYETWLVNLHLTNTQASQEEWDAEAHAAWEVAREDLEAVSDVPFDDDHVQDEAVVILGRMMRDTFDGDNCPEVEGFYGDLLRAAVSDVNWFEIAKHFIASVREEESHATD